MAATVLIREKNGSGETATDKTSGTVRFKNADNATVDANDPLVIPSSGQEYSFEKWLQMQIGGTGPDTNITNLEFYMDGSNDYGTGVELWCRAVAAFETPGIPSESNDPPEVPVNGTPAAATDAFTYNLSGALSLGAGPYSGTNTDIGDYLILVMEVETSASQGSLSAETATFRYDEI